MLRRKLAVLFLLAAMPAAAASAATQWLHVRIDDAAKGKQVSVNVPVSLVETIAAWVPAPKRGRFRMEVDGCQIGRDEMRSAWAQVRNVQDGKSVDIRRKDHLVRISKSRGRMVMNVSEGSERPALIEMPATVADLLLFRSDDDIEFVEVMRALASSGADGGFTIVGDDGDIVRMWVDASSGGR